MKNAEINRADVTTNNANVFMQLCSHRLGSELPQLLSNGRRLTAIKREYRRHKNGQSDMESLERRLYATPWAMARSNGDGRKGCSTRAAKRGPVQDQPLRMSIGKLRRNSRQH